eukprot:4051676-Ditylum_brightwellii.AAC.1
MEPSPKPPSTAATTSSTIKIAANDNNNTIANNGIEVHDAGLLSISMNSTTSTDYQYNDASITVHDMNCIPHQK